MAIFHSNVWYYQRVYLSISKFQANNSAPPFWCWDSSIYPTTSRPWTSPAVRRCVGGCVRKASIAHIEFLEQPYYLLHNIMIYIYIYAYLYIYIYIRMYIYIYTRRYIIPGVYGWTIQPFTGPNSGIFADRNVVSVGSFRTQVLPPMDSEKL